MLLCLRNPFFDVAEALIISFVNKVSIIELHDSILELKTAGQKLTLTA